MAKGLKKHAPVAVRVPHSSQTISDNNINDAAALPDPDPLLIDAICDVIMTEQPNVKRPPEKSAALLALAIELHKINQPFPTRMAAAIKLDCSVFTIDAALSTRMDEGYLTQVVETTTGNVTKRNSIVRQRYYVPSKGLLDVAEAIAKQRGKRT